MTLHEYVKVFRAHWVAIMLITVAGGAIAFGWAALQTKVYTAYASAVVTADSSSEEGSALVGNDPESNVKSYVDIAMSRTVAERAGEIAGIEEIPDALLERITVANPSDTAVLRIYAHGPTAEQARDLADAWVTALTETVAQIEGSRPLDSAVGAASTVSLQPLDSAALPFGPSAPKVKLTVALGLIVGLVVGVFVAVIRSSQDRRLRSASDIERLLEIPVVGALPFDADIARSGVTAGRDDFAMNEAIRQLRTNLQFVDVDHPPRVIVVTSALPGDGKSTTVTKLAEAIADGGRNVVLVDADLRRPAIAPSLGLTGAVGLTDVLVGRVEIEDALQPYGPTGHLRVLASGSIPPNPSELLGSDAMHSLLYSFPADTMVLVDSPPLLPVTDAAVLTARTDGALVVARAGRTTIDELEQAVRDLERVKGRAIGAILDGVPRRGAYRSSYRGAYVYAQSAPDDAAAGKEHRDEFALQSPEDDPVPELEPDDEAEREADADPKFEHGDGADEVDVDFDAAELDVSDLDAAELDLGLEPSEEVVAPGGSRARSGKSSGANG